MPWEDVRNEMINEKGLSAEIAEKIWSYVQIHGRLSSNLVNLLSR